MIKKQHALTFKMSMTMFLLVKIKRQGIINTCNDIHLEEKNTFLPNVRSILAN